MVMGERELCKSMTLGTVVGGRQIQVNKYLRPEEKKGTLEHMFNRT